MSLFTRYTGKGPGGGSIGTAGTGVSRATSKNRKREEKKRARINMIAHLLSSIPFEPVEQTKLKLPKRPKSTGYERTDRGLQLEVPDHAARLSSDEKHPKYEDPEDSDSS